MVVFVSLFQWQTCRAAIDPEIISGRLVDDSTGEPIHIFAVQTSTPTSANPGDVSWNHYMMGDAQNPGRFSAPSPTSNKLVRILSVGYAPQILTVQSNLPVSGLEIRLKRDDGLGGVVMDDAGRPVAGARVLLATIDRVILKDGRFEYGPFGGASTYTDGGGRFSFRGVGGTTERIVVVSPDGHLIWPAIQSEPGQELKVVLPKSGTLILHYDIPEDAAKGNPEIYLQAQQKEMKLWTNVGFGLTLSVANGSELVVSNLTPGTYMFRRWKSTADGQHGVESEAQTVEVHAGDVQRIEMVRTNGHSIRGRVTGPEAALRSGGYIYVKSAESTGLPWPQRSRNEQNEYNYRSFDVSQFGPDGSFQTGMLEPGSYTIFADVYPPKDPSMGMSYRNEAPDYVAVAKVTVTNEAVPPLNLNLSQAQYVNIDGRGVDDMTDMAIPDFMVETGKINPDNGEFIWGGGFEGTAQGAGVPEGRFSLWNMRPGEAVRLLANGYVPQTFSRDEIIASRHTANLQVRMKRGRELSGIVLDYAGRPVTGAAVYLAPLELGYARFGWVMGSGTGDSMLKYYAHTFATTDAAGHFAFQGVGPNPTRVIVVSADGQMVHPVEVSGPGQNLNIRLPQPATLIIHYDIPGDLAEADFKLTLHSNEMKIPLWKYVGLHTTAQVTNGGQTVLSNLNAGTYDLSRPRMGGPIPEGYSYSILQGDPATSLESDYHKIILEQGRTQEIRFARSIGQRIQGKVTGLESITNLYGAFLYVGLAATNGNPWDFKSKMEAYYDAVKLDKDGSFQTALLEPGSYMLVAAAYRWREVSKPTYADDEPQYGGILRMAPLRLEFVATANLTVTSNTPSPLVKMEFHPWADSLKSP
jgi:hypothetical protein